MEDKLALFFFNFIIPAIVGFSFLYSITTLQGDDKANAIILVSPLVIICMGYFYKNVRGLFKNLRSRK